MISFSNIWNYIPPNGTTALVAARFNRDLAQKYHKLIATGKPAKVAITCLMRKLIELENVLIKANRNWQPKQAWPRRIL